MVGRLAFNNLGVSLARQDFVLNRTKEQIMDKPVLQALRFIPQDPVQDRTETQDLDVPVNQILEHIVKAACFVPQEVVQDRTKEHRTEVPVRASPLRKSALQSTSRSTQRFSCRSKSWKFFFLVYDNGLRGGSVTDVHIVHRETTCPREQDNKEKITRRGALV